jgi:hypothetical protein
MRRFIRYVLLILFVSIVGVAVFIVLYLRPIINSQPQIAAVKIDSPLHEYCSEAPTTHDFDQYWTRFRDAVRAQDKLELFSLIHTCGFTWEPGPTEPNLHLKRADCIVTPVKDCVPPEFMVGGPLIIETRRDFELNYDRIFPKTTRDRVLNGKAWKEAERRYDLSWDSGPNECLSLVFEDLDNFGYKFTGLEWGPYPASFLKEEANRRLPLKNSQPSPPPSSTP